MDYKLSTSDQSKFSKKRIAVIALGRGLPPVRYIGRLAEIRYANKILTSRRDIPVVLCRIININNVQTQVN
jgi:hypothetical protein